MSHSAFIRLEHIKKSFGSFVAVNDVSLELDQGDMLCLLGPSGCGKSTLLRLIAGLERLDHGRVIKQGQDISALAASQRGCGIVFQSYALFPNLNVADNICYGMRSRKWPKDKKQQRLSELLDVVHLNEQRDKYPSQLSGGQQQRVALARALAVYPDFLLLDEPLSALDKNIREDLRGELKLIQKKLNVTTIFVTHDQEEALMLGDKVAVMNKGQVLQMGPSEEIYQTPQKRFTAEFVGVMNFFHGRRNDRGDVFIGETKIEGIDHSSVKEGRFEVGIRPENLTVSSHHGIEAILEEVDYLGSFYRLKLSCRYSDKQIAVDLKSDADRQVLLEKGKQIYLQADGSKSLIFAEEA